ncbi:hypothetical protein O6H91_15G080900 [Diphasiastrum complanatum]|uniref:Uncharacterized protein n=3 Tax=Diphasiastrum complanatum TaxID=34168 RepID=A0ACC2BGT2_DIPCM|nr:hypothetical protein O6H91_15G025200 [Diphasiastrum complanatum]KAJ7528905.1 hypothetical protein O6H91_15G025200 [Diphasiastrum complanatum]KAJ7530140.1 hypothetical protein O6H91_15G080900 [Diphasiastrum complanatum]
MELSRRLQHLCCRQISRHKPDLQIPRHKPDLQQPMYQLDFRRYLRSEDFGPDWGDYVRRKEASIKDEKQCFREEMFERACRRFERGDYEGAERMFQDLGTDKDMEGAFKQYDNDKDGFVTTEELQDYLAKFHIYPGKENVGKMIALADEDGDGRVSLPEFINMIKGK